MRILISFFPNCHGGLFPGEWEGEEVNKCPRSSLDTRTMKKLRGCEELTNTARLNTIQYQRLKSVQIIIMKNKAMIFLSSGVFHRSMTLSRTTAKIIATNCDNKILVVQDGRRGLSWKLKGTYHALKEARKG